MNLMKFFGFENDDDDYENDDDYAEERRTERKTQSRKPRAAGPAAGKIIIYNGVAGDDDKRKLREAFNDGAMILVDLHTLNPREYEEDGKVFITFMGGLAFAKNGEVKYIEPSQYLFTPRPNMCEIWPGESEA